MLEDTLAQYEPQSGLSCLSTEDFENGLRLRFMARRIFARYSTKGWRRDTSHTPLPLPSVSELMGNRIALQTWDDFFFFCCLTSLRIARELCL